MYFEVAMYFVGQRWFSEAEPELGIGLISDQEHKQVTVFFPAVGVTRTYSKSNPPIKRVHYKEGDTISVVTDQSEKSAIVTQVETQNNIFFYICGEEVFPETLLKPDVFFTNPQDKILAGNFDRNNLFELRYESFLHLRAYQQCKTKGLLGPKVALLPHQLSVTQEVNKRTKIRVMLADEVGLGKTIEAALIINSLVMRSKAQRILIMTPDSLINQWFVELYRKFNLSFAQLQAGDEIPTKEDSSPYYLTNFSATDDEAINQFLRNTAWDVVVVDEAHQVSGTNKKHPKVFELLQYLSKNVPNLLLLTATPEILGPQEHFERLQLLDEVRFNNFEQYKKEVAHYQDLIPLINDLISGKMGQEQIKQKMGIEGENFPSDQAFINFLIDCHGTGRIYFRNTRENLEKHDIHFPKRKLHTHPLSIEGKIDDKVVLEQKAMIITEVLAANTNEKMLVICHNKNLVLKLQKMIAALTNTKVATFHSDQSVLERDRQSAFFADADGAQLMLSTEAGSEGRNFEFAHHLFLLDIPKVPDQLEQRIGRLDRIGQSKDINIHVPFVERSFEEILFSFYRDVLHSFDKCPQGAMALYTQVRDSLHQLIESPFDAKSLASFIEQAQNKYEEILNALASGHDRLLDLSSFNEKLAAETVDSVQEMVHKNNLREYLAKVFDTIGVEVTEINDYADYAVPSSNMRLPSYPALTEEGLRYSYDRSFALKHDDIALMSWEHPLAQGTIELFVDSELGNVTVVQSEKPLPFKIGFECIFRLESVASKNDDINMFFPMTPLRALVDIAGVDYTAKVKMSSLKGSLLDVSDEYREQLKGLPKAQINEVINKAKALAKTRIDKYTETAKQEVKAHFEVEIARLEELSKRSNLVGKDDIKELIAKRDLMLERLNSPQMNVDSIRMIIAG